MRCMPLATDGGASTWTTRSIAPMSMPSSSDDVATSARRRPALRSSAMRADELEQARMDRRPDARPSVRARRRTAADLKCLRTELRHVIDRHLDAELELLGVPGVDDLHRTRAVRVEAAEETRDLVERSLCRGEPDALQRMTGELLEPLERQREMRAALRRHHRMDLVDDHGADASEALARGARQHEVQRFRRRDEDVGGRLGESEPLPRGRVAGPRRDARLAKGGAEALGHMADADKRTAEVALDVDGEGFERRDVHDAASRGIRVKQLVDG